VRQLVPWRRQYAVLLSRALKEQYRKTGVVATQLAQAVLIAVLIGTVFLQVRLALASNLQVFLWLALRFYKK
jgi:hypothetical protein